ncbi:MAG: hypothetical protein PHR28_09200 [candidate division Zixibacteria bacterium]|nr:hypothetical protein [candidate division Zixibacteria bacterium]
MTEFRVTWEINLDAETPTDAAKRAFAIQRDPISIATVFSVTNPQGAVMIIDLLDQNDANTAPSDHPVPPWARCDDLDTRTVIVLATDLARYATTFDSYDEYIWWIIHLTREFMADHPNRETWDGFEYPNNIQIFERRALHQLVDRRPVELP